MEGYEIPVMALIMPMFIGIFIGYILGNMLGYSRGISSAARIWEKSYNNMAEIFMRTLKEDKDGEKNRR